jgi:hypothetical protein
MVLKFNAMRQGLVNRATLGDLGEAFSLCIIEITLDVDVAGDLFDETSVRYITVLAVVRMNAREIVACAYRFQRPAFVLAVPG